MRILLWHGYLLGGTGSNVYTRMLAREWSNAGHRVTVLSQEPNPEQYDLGTADTVRPDVGGLLPVFVIDRYAGYDVRRVQECTRAELETGWRRMPMPFESYCPPMSSSRIMSSLAAPWGQRAACHSR